MSNLRKTLIGRGGQRPPRVSFGAAAFTDCTPVKWTKYFENKKEVQVQDNTFNVYLAGNTGPILVMIHGGGYSALTWALLSEEILNRIECQVMAIDLRGHGSTQAADEGNLALDRLAEDVGCVLKAFYEDELPNVVLVGHSLGGAVAVAASYLIPTVVGVCVIDVVEGTALESLSAMQSILRGRPSNFPSIEEAIYWSFRSGQTHNLQAARISMPGQLKSLATGELAANEIPDPKPEPPSASGSTGEPALPSMPRLVHQRSADAIEEELEDEKIDDSESSDNLDDPFPNLKFKVPKEKAKYTWRIDLSKTEPFWNGWFKGLSQKFLDITAPKVLLLANIHGLDTALTVGQMQGKFQLQVLPRSGHAIHEDQPLNVADIIAGFLVKQKLVVSKHGFTPTMPAC